MKLMKSIQISTIIGALLLMCLGCSDDGLYSPETRVGNIKAASDALNKAFEELVKSYGQGLVRSVPHSFKHKKDTEGKITYIIEGKFIIYIPEKNKWGEKTK